MNISRSISIPRDPPAAPIVDVARWAASGGRGGRRVAGLAGSAALHAVMAVAVVALGVRAIQPVVEPARVEMVFDPAPSPSAAVAPPSVPEATPAPPELAPAEAAAPTPVTAAPEPAEAVAPPPSATAAPVPVTATPAPAEPVAPPPEAVAPPVNAPLKLATPAQPAVPRPRAPVREAIPRPRVAEPAAQGGSTTPAPPAPSAPAPPQAATQPASIDPGWQRAVSTWLATHRRYPEQARMRGQEGDVGVAFTADRDGRVLSVTITRSSGSPLLDQAVRDMLTGQRVPAFPAGMPQVETSLSLPVHFRLEP